MSTVKIPGKGRAIIADRDYDINDLIEETNVISFPKEEVLSLDKTLLKHYYFAWYNDTVAILTGNGLMYNHWAENPSMRLEGDEVNMTMKFVARRKILKGEELTFDYGYEIVNSLPPVVL